ncbi:hypothetical protein [Streptomyces calidiresistens]|nr:hypothetical protein [Streptomyces calidiresistens]
MEVGEEVSARLRMEDASCIVLDDPSEEQVYDTIADLNSRFRYAVLQRLDVPGAEAGQCYIQVWLHDDGGYIVEHREGGPDRHFRVRLAPAPGPFGNEPVARLVWSWARPGDESWRTAVAWQPWSGDGLPDP